MSPPKILIRVCTVMAGLLAGSATALAVQWQWTTLDIPGFNLDRATGISGDNIVGAYYDSSSRYQAYLFNGTSFTTLKCPSSTETYAMGVSGNNVVGYSKAGYNPELGFLYDGQTWKTFAHPYPFPHPTKAYGMSGNRIVGTYGRNGTEGIHGFVYADGHWTTLDYPGSYETQARAIDDARIVGIYRDGRGMHGFLYDGVRWQPLDCPEPGAWNMVPTGISGTRIVGSYFNAANRLRGFLYDGSTWTTLNYPGAYQTMALGIDGDRIVGWSDSNGFVLTIPEPAMAALLALSLCWPT